MAELLELIITCFGELFFQLVVELLVEGFFRLLSDEVHEARRARPVGTFFGLFLLGGLLGGVSVSLLPHHFIHAPALRWANVFITPLVAGVLMAWLGSWHNKHGRRVVGLDKFFNGWGFALAFALVRLKWCH